jgi:hypothetical protein
MDTVKIIAVCEPLSIASERPQTSALGPLAGLLYPGMQLNPFEIHKYFHLKDAATAVLNASKGAINISTTQTVL